MLGFLFFLAKQWSLQPMPCLLLPLALPGGAVLWMVSRGGRNHRIKESQNVRDWKGPLGIPQSNLLQKQGHLEQAAQHRVQVGLEYLQRRRLHNLPGQPEPCL